MKEGLTVLGANIDAIGEAIQENWCGGIVACQKEKKRK